MRMLLLLACLAARAGAQHEFTALPDEAPGKLSSCYWRFHHDGREVLGWSTDMTIACLADAVQAAWIAQLRQQRQALLAFARAGLADPGVPREVAGLCGTLHGLLDVVPAAGVRRFPGLAEEIAAEVDDVRSRRRAAPRFVRSWDPAVEWIDWSLWQAEGVAAEDAELGGLLAAVAYVRHADAEHVPAFTDWLRRTAANDGPLRPAMARLQAVQQSERLLLGTPQVGPFDPATGAGTLAPRYRPREAGAVAAALLQTIGRPAGPCDVELPFAAGDDDGSLRDAVLATFDAVQQQRDVPFARRLDAAMCGYLGLREVDVVATMRGPVTGTPSGRPKLYVEPHLAVLTAAERACERLVAAWRAIDPDAAARAGALRPLFACLRRCLDAQQHGAFGSEEDMDAILAAWQSAGASHEHRRAAVTVRDPDADLVASPPAILLRREGMVPASGRVRLGDGEIEVWTALARFAWQTADGTWRTWDGAGEPARRAPRMPHPGERGDR